MQTPTCYALTRPPVPGLKESKPDLRVSARGSQARAMTAMTHICFASVAGRASGRHLDRSREHGIHSCEGLGRTGLTLFLPFTRLLRARAASCASCTPDLSRLGSLVL